MTIPRMSINFGNVLEIGMDCSEVTFPLNFTAGCVEEENYLFFGLFFLCFYIVLFYHDKEDDGKVA